MDLDFLSGILDEVALEGLDGITLSMLWVRVGNRPHFPIALDDDSKLFLWECIAIHKDIEIYELQEPREFFPIYNRYDNIDSEIGIVIEPLDPIKDMYPVEFVKDGDIRGSCSTYYSRKCITSKIRSNDVLIMSLNQVVEKWGESLVLVASPKARLLSLIGTETNPMTDFSMEEYCLLERIGRSRYLGEVTQGEAGLLQLKVPFCRQLHYYRKKLSLKGLVTKQLFYLKTRKGNASTGSLFHLTRFYVQHKSKMQLLMKCICDILKNKPNQRETCKVLRQELNVTESTFKKIFYRPFQKWVKIVTLPCREMNPNATKKESFTTLGQEKIVKVVQLLKPYEETEIIEDEEYNDKNFFPNSNPHFDGSKLFHDIPLMSLIYKYIHDAGSEGISSTSITKLCTLPRLDVRSVLKLLMKKKIIFDVLQERGRQKEKKYISKNYVSQSEAYSKVKEGEEQLGKEIPNPNSLNEAETLGKRKYDGTLCDNNEEPSMKKVRFDEKVKEFISKNSDEGIKISSSIPKIVSEISEITNFESFTGKPPKLISLTEKVVPVTSASNMQLTLRKLKRINMILEYLKSVGSTLLSDLQKYLTEKEKEEGYNFKLDKKSTSRVVHSLFLAQKLKIFKAVIKLDNKKAELEFICDNSVKSTDPCIQLVIEQAKFKFFSVSKEKQKKIEAESAKLSEPTSDSNMELINTTKSVSNPKTEYLAHPKFMRFKTLHKFLFYLVHQYEGCSTEENLENSSDFPVVYHDSMTWKRFVPPLHNENRKGWCFLADVFTRMPLSIFVKVVNLWHRAKQVSGYLEHPEKCHYLIKYLPQKALNILLENRRYLFATDDVIKGLCYMGLVSLGPQISNQKDQMYMYLHKRATFKDTSISPASYLYINPNIIYEKKVFNFNSLTDIDTFWYELENVCFNTQLGKYSSAIGQTITITDASHKPELLKALKHKNFDEVFETDEIPGDGLGAGGFDSVLFLHSRRNWYPQNTVRSRGSNNKSLEDASSSISIQKLLENKDILGTDSSNRLKRLARYRSLLKKDSKIELPKVKKSHTSKSPASSKTKKRKKIKIRTVKQRPKRIRTPYIDEKDKVAIEKMSKARCEWSAQEDSFLLLCKVASSFLDPTSRSLCVPYTVVRDLLHEHLPELSECKTSRACQRRVRYMMLNPTTTNNVAVFLGEVKQDINLIREFDRTKLSKTNEECRKNLFTNLLKRLLEKFTLPAANRCKSITLPDDIEELKKCFDLVHTGNVFHRRTHHKDPTNEEDVIQSTLYFLIVSAMAIVHDSTEWSYLLYKLYQAYPENVLKSVVSRLRSEKVIAIRKKTLKRNAQNTAMLAFPYRFSITYENTMLTKFPIKLFKESKELLENFKNSIPNQGLQLKNDIAPGYMAAILALICLKNLTLHIKIPDQIISIDSNLSKEFHSSIVKNVMNSLSDKESAEFSKLLNSDEEKLVCENKDSEQNDTLADVCNSVEDSLMKSDSNISTYENQRMSASRFALYLLRHALSQPPIEKVQHSQDYIVLNSCEVICKVTPPASKFISDSSPYKQGIFQLKQNALPEHRDKILTDGCISEIKASLTAYIPPTAFSPNQNFEECLEVMYDSYSPQTLNDARCIFGAILKYKTAGVTEIKLWTQFRKLGGELSLFEHLHLFREAVIVLRVGVTTFTYVSISFAKNWVLTSYELPEIYHMKNSYSEQYIDESQEMDLDVSVPSRSLQLRKRGNKTKSSVSMNSDMPMAESAKYCYSDSATLQFTEKVYFIPRTWRYPDGSLNKTVFIELLQTILSYIISSPGTSTYRVTERFSLVLQPVQTLEILEILEKAYCIVKYYTKNAPKRTLFSTPFIHTYIKHPDPGDLDHLESLPDAICNLARIQEAIV